MIHRHTGGQLQETADDDDDTGGGIEEKISHRSAAVDRVSEDSEVQEGVLGAPLNAGEEEDEDRRHEEQTKRLDIHPAPLRTLGHIELQADDAEDQRGDAGDISPALRVTPRAVVGQGSDEEEPEECDRCSEPEDPPPAEPLCHISPEQGAKCGTTPGTHTPEANRPLSPLLVPEYPQQCQRRGHYAGAAQPLADTPQQQDRCCER